MRDVLVYINEPNLDCKWFLGNYAADDFGVVLKAVHLIVYTYRYEVFLHLVISV